ncbi:MAG: type III secretion inner membrane ring lipoprotein SctJ [Puniceicoccales bacterium]|jgi:type III secretion protein J|nr:type III secretion inner membrane ring lipoprotein SctJ [Puniceicoccales bacterium]
MANFRKWYSLLLCSLALLGAGCGKAILYSNVSERQANEMISLLRARHVNVDKLPGAENSWTVSVAGHQFAAAVDILGTYGYPRDEFSTLGRVFQKAGLVSSPTEERARLMYALSETLAENISHIHGVITARVNIVLPESNPYSESTSPSSAAVFVTYRPGSGIEDAVREIKYLVTNSIEGLNYDKVSVALFPTSIIAEEIAPEDELISVLAIRMTRSSILPFCIFVAILLVVIAIVSFAGAKIIFDYLSVRNEEKQKKQKKQKKEGEEGEENDEDEEGEEESEEG